MPLHVAEMRPIAVFRRHVDALERAAVQIAELGRHFSLRHEQAESSVSDMRCPSNNQCAVDDRARPFCAASVPPSATDQICGPRLGAATPMPMHRRVTAHVLS